MCNTESTAQPNLDVLHSCGFATTSRSELFGIEACIAAILLWQTSCQLSVGTAALCDMGEHSRCIAAQHQL